MQSDRRANRNVRSPPIADIGARNDERLIFCPSLPVPRNRTVPADSLNPIESPAITLREDGGSAKRKRSIFKFLLNPQVAADEARTP